MRPPYRPQTQWNGQPESLDQMRRPALYNPQQPHQFRPSPAFPRPSSIPLTHNPQVGGGPPPPQIRRKPQLSTSYYYYLLLKQAWPFMAFILVILLFITYKYHSKLTKLLVLPAMGTNKVHEVHGPPAIDLSKIDPALLRKGMMAQKYEQFGAVYGLVFFSSYRTGPKTIAVVGLAGLVLREAKKIGHCLWKETGGGHRVKGKIQVFYPGEHHDLKYEVVVLLCNLEDSTDHDTGGKLIMQLDGEDIVVYQEASGAFAMGEPKAPFKHKLEYCSHPIHAPMDPKRLYEWIEFHFHQGVDHMTFYDAGGFDELSAAVLEPYAARGLVEIINFRKMAEYDIWAHGTVLAMNDCAYRAHYRAKWVVTFEMSEYFESNSGITLSSLLETFPGKPYVTFGTRWWSLEKCLPDPEKKLWAVQRMIFHWPHIYCVNKDKYPKNELCLDYFGFRRYAVDPRQVAALQIHRTEVPQTGGVDVDADVARINRWPNLIEKVSKACTHAVQPTEVVDWWIRDLGMGNAAVKAQTSPVSKFKNQS